MPSWLQVLNQQNMTESDFYEAPCKRRCGELIPSHWDESTAQWVYDHPCSTCERTDSLERRRRFSLESSGLTSAEQVLDLKSFIPDKNNKDAHDAARRIALGEAINLYLYGSAGRGKTHLAAGIVLSRIDVAKTKFFPITKGLMEIRGHLREISEDEYITKLLSCDILVIDDFGSNKLTEWNLSFMDCFIDEWYRMKKKGLILTSNFSLKEISEKISDRIASRLAQMCEVYELSGKDHRI